MRVLNKNERITNGVAPKQVDNDRSLREARAKIGKTGNERIATANIVTNRKLFGNFFREREVTILAAKPGVGKTILAMSIVDTIANGKSSLLGCPNETEAGFGIYYDLELSDDQFKARYPNHDFGDNITFITMNDLEEQIFSIDIIKEHVKATKPSWIVIDNITASGIKYQNETVLKSLITELKEIASAGVAILIVYHPKIMKSNVPLTIECLAGSAMAGRLSDSLFFIAQSAKGNDIFYIKHERSRSLKEERILECRKVDVNGFLTFEFSKWGDKEEDHFLKKTSKEQEVNWLEIFGDETELCTDDLKSELFERYDMKDSTSRKYISKYLEAVRKGSGLYRIP
jgi:hypothetical protein